MKFKKIVCVLLSFLFFGANFFGMEAKALFGITHFNLAKKMIEKYSYVDKKSSKTKQTPSESEKLAFLSGTVYADIGRFKFDKETGVASDSDKFANEMEKLAETNEEKWFACGFKVHVFQDKKTKEFLSEVLGRDYSSYYEYIINCGILDSYFYKKSGMLCNNFLNEFNFEQVSDGWDIEELSKKSGIPKDKIKSFAELIIKKYSGNTGNNNLVIYDGLIKETYKSLGHEISLDEIHQQAGNLLGALMIISAFIDRKKEIPEALCSRIEEKSKEFADLCVSSFDFMKDKN